MVKRYKICLIMAGLLGVLGACGKETDSVPELLEPVEVKVDTAVVQTGDIYEIQGYSAQIVPAVEAVAFSQDGAMGEILVMIGDQVEEGQLLAGLDNEALQEQLEELEEQLAYTVQMGEFQDRQIELSIEIAEHEAERIRTGWGNYEQLLLKESEAEALKLDLEQQKENRSLEIENQSRLISQLKDELEKTKLTAPISGTVVYVAPYEKGNAVKGYEPIVCIANNEKIHISSEFISESTIASAEEIYVQVADKKYQVRYVPYEKEEYMRLLLEQEELDTLFEVEGDMTGLESGQFAVVVVKLHGKESVLVIPVNALHADAKGRYVYRMEDGDRVRQYVVAGLVTDVEVEIREGLQEGDVIYVKE